MEFSAKSRTLFGKRLPAALCLIFLCFTTIARGQDANGPGGPELFPAPTGLPPSTLDAGTPPSTLDGSVPSYDDAGPAERAPVKDDREPLEDQPKPPRRQPAPPPGAKLPFNLRVSASEQLLNKLMSRQEVQQGLVRDSMMGADIFGRQVTDTQVTVKLKPSQAGARFDVLLHGNTVSTTRGVTQQAAVDVIGRYNFQAVKEVLFDGAGLKTRPATLMVNSSNQTVGAQTTLSCIPIVGRIADNYAMNVSESRRPQSEAMAGYRVAQKVLPLFNSTVDKELGKGNETIEKEVRPKLKAMELLPNAEQAWTTETHFYYASTLGIPPASIAPPPATAGTGNGVTICVHESLFNHVIDLMHIDGETVTDEQMKAFGEGFMKNLLPENMRPPAGKVAKPKDESAHGSSATYVFAQRDPIRVHFDDNTLTVTVRSGFERDSGDPIPEQHITVPMQMSLSPNHVVLDPGKVSIAPAVPPSNPTTQLLHEGAIVKRVQSNFGRIELDRKLKLPLSSGGSFNLLLSQLTADDGWLTLSFDYVDSNNAVQGPALGSQGIDPFADRRIVPQRRGVVRLGPGIDQY